MNKILFSITFYFLVTTRFNREIQKENFQEYVDSHCPKLIRIAQDTDTEDISDDPICINSTSGLCDFWKQNFKANADHCGWSKYNADWLANELSIGADSENYKKCKPDQKEDGEGKRDIYGSIYKTLVQCGNDATRYAYQYSNFGRCYDKATWPKGMCYAEYITLNQFTYSKVSHDDIVRDLTWNKEMRCVMADEKEKKTCLETIGSCEAHKFDDEWNDTMLKKLVSDKNRTAEFQNHKKRDDIAGCIENKWFGGQDDWREEISQKYLSCMVQSLKSIDQTKKKDVCGDIKKSINISQIITLGVQILIILYLI